MCNVPLLHICMLICAPKSCHAGGADEDATDVPVQERQIGFVFQSYALFKHMTVAQNIAFGPRIRKKGMDLERRSAPTSSLQLRPILIIQ